MKNVEQTFTVEKAEQREMLAFALKHSLRPFPRIECPFRNTAEPAMLSYFGSQENSYRIYVCDNYRRCLKAIDLSRARRRTVFPVERVTMVDLDVAARQEGYH